MHSGTEPRGVGTILKMSTSGDCREGHERVPHDSMKQFIPQKAVMSMESKLAAVQAGHGPLLWSTPKGKIISQKLGSLNLVPVIIKSQTYRAMLNIGAGVNCVHKHVIDKFGLDQQMSTTSSRVLHDAQGQKMKVFGELSLPIIYIKTPVRWEPRLVQRKIYTLWVIPSLPTLHLRYTQ